MLILMIIYLPNGEHVHHYQRGRASLTGFKVEIQEFIETERLVVVARCGLIGVFIGLRLGILPANRLSAVGNLLRNLATS
jgi:hypothetical protein